MLPFPLCLGSEHKLYKCILCINRGVCLECLSGNAGNKRNNVHIIDSVIDTFDKMYQLNGSG